MRYDIVFTTSRFNLTEVKEHFINPCCFGEDLAAWLQQQLLAKDVQAHAPDQEDWGWYTGANFEGSAYFIGVSGNPNEGASGDNAGEWRIAVEKVRTIKDRLFGRNRMSADDEFLVIVRAIIESESDFSDVRVE